MCATTVRRFVSKAATRRRDASCWLRAASIALRSKDCIAACCASTWARRRRCSSARERRTLSSSGSSRDMAPPVAIGGAGAGAVGAGRGGRGRDRLRVGALLLLVGGGGFDPADDRVDELAAGAPCHTLGELLVVERRERLPAAAAGEEVRLERALLHLLEEGAEEGLRHPRL